MTKQDGDTRNDLAEGDESSELVTLGHVSGAHGIKGWIKVHSDTRPRDNIFEYLPWLLGRDGNWQTWKPRQGKQQGKYLIAQLQGCEDRNQAESLNGMVIAVRRGQLPAVEEDGVFYWADLTGLAVVTVDGIELGVIDHLFETGANDVMVVRGDRERLIPYIWERVVRDVDLEQGRLVVDWDPEF